jgi:flagellar motor switch protein FliG
MRIRSVRPILLGILLTASCIPLCRPLFAKTGSAGVETKIALEESLERRLKSLIGQILGNNDVIVIVTADMYTEDEKRAADSEPAAMSVLPGVPMKENIGERDTLASLSLGDTRTLVKRLSATIVLDKSVAEADVSVIKNATSGLLGLKPDRGDVLEIQHMDFHRGEAKGFNWHRFLTPPDLWYTMGLGLAAFFILFMTAFFFGSFRIFIREFVKALRSYAESMEEQIKMMQMQKTREAELATRNAPEAELLRETESLLGRKSPAGAAAIAAPHGENGKNGGPPFSFLNESHLRNLKILLKKENPAQVAIVVNYLPPALANDVLASLDPARQAEVVNQLSRVDEKDPDLVKAVETKIRERIAFVVGGEDRLQALLDQADPAAQQTMLETVTLRDAELAQRLRGRLFTIEDLGKLDGPVLAAIVRRVNARVLAAVLHETPAEIQERILSNLPAGSAAILKEEINLAKPLPPQRLAQEQRRILDAIRRLNDEGVIQLRRDTPQ